MKLDQIPPGIQARVKMVAVADDYQDAHGQLEDIGFLPGELVTVLRKGLLGHGPILVRIGSSTFALRESEAHMIELESI